VWNGETSVGATVHRVEATLDTGPIIAEGTVPIEKHSTLQGLRIRLDALGDRLVCDAVTDMRRGTAQFRAQPAGGRTYTRPTLAQERQLQRRLVAPGTLTTLAKNSVLRTYSVLNGGGHALRDRVMVFLYHRVSDSYRDWVTVGIEQFDQHIRFLADNYPIVSVHDLLAGTIPRQGPVVAITFDDGYLDNYENAAPILLKHGANAPFFVSTDNVARNEPFQHDLDGLGHGLPNMSWHQIRELQREGLAFGSHTANHINLATSDPQLVQVELARSRQALQDELGITQPLFAYPFGRRRDLKAEQVADIKAAGYVCNCSAYGGVNTRQIDRWDIKRQGVDYRFNPTTLRARIAGIRATQYA